MSLVCDTLNFVNFGGGERLTTYYNFINKLGVPSRFFPVQAMSMGTGKARSTN